jgi:hypothetical protein
MFPSQSLVTDDTVLHDALDRMSLHQVLVPVTIVWIFFKKP